jgi:hypothetical protein
MRTVHASSRTLAAVAVMMLTPFALRTAYAEQHEQHGSHSISTSSLHVEVDGARTPERVSDYIAYRQFIRAAAQRDDASAESRERGAAFVRRIGLTPTDAASLTAALKSVRERLDDVSVEKQAVGAAAPASARMALRQREEAVFDGANRRIRAFLSKEGWRRLDQFVREEVKPNIKVYTSTLR